MSASTARSRKWNGARGRGGDRRIGYSRTQYDRVHLHGPYDVEVDTSVLGLEAVAEVIKDALAAPPVPSAFSRIWERATSQRAGD